MQAAQPALQKLNRWLKLTLLSVLTLIVIGGIVRASGSGMGCPDWPRCFGQWIPPVSESQLPPDYQIKYSAHGNTAQPFNAARTWTEYLNRLAGVTVGFLFLGLVWHAWQVRTIDRSQLTLAVVGTALVGFQGWLGARVVASTLAPMVVTTHMMVALIILAVLVVQRVRLRSTLSLEIRPVNRPPMFLGWSMGLGVGLSLVIMLGTQVRESIDTITDNLSIPLPPNWTQIVGWGLDIHKWLAVALFFGLIFFCRQLIDHNPTNDRILRQIKWMMALFITQLATGAIFILLNVPSVLQPIHLGLAAALFVLYLELILTP